MAWEKKYDISGSSYTRLMEEKTTRYTVLIRKAERTNREQDGKPTKEEATFYYDASKVCEEIMNLNLSQRHVYDQWKYRKQECEENFKRIADILLPPPPKKVEKEPEKPAAETQERPRVQKNTNSQNAAAAKPAAKDSGNCPEGLAEKHAIKEVPAETIKGWFPDIPENGFDGVIGRTDLKERLLNEAGSFGWNKLDSTLNINPVQCYFLYGPPGTGKTHLIKAFASELSKKDFRFMQLTGSDIHSQYVGIAEKIVSTAFAVATDAAPCLIFIDEIDNLCVKRGGKTEGHEQRLTVAFLEAYNKFKDSRKRLIFMGATNHPGKVDDAMLDRVSMIKIPLPAEEDRVGYFDRMVNTKKDGEKVPRIFLEEGFTVEDMAEVTDNHSYRDLDRLQVSMLNKLKAQAISQNRVLDEAGNIDQDASDEQASAAIINGDILLTREIFEAARKENPPSDKTGSRQELVEFEKHVAGGFE